ncbi:hypothetical protein CIB48_g5853 [Xylaria polymorpha]|nr:hypothetical protein CIB48_g5853 [Xylaria polymorpha]
MADDEDQPAKRVKTDVEDQGNSQLKTTATPLSHILTRETADPTAFREAVWGHVSTADETRPVCPRPSSTPRVWRTSGTRSSSPPVCGAACRRTKIVSCSPSATGEMLNGFLRGQGRMFAGGHCPDVGLGGFLLQGGMGWNCKNWGWACESIIGIDVVTADSREIYCSNTENSDLFWAARGAGPGFPAIVTGFHLLTRPFLPMYNTVYVYPRSMFHTVLQWVIDTCPTADPDTEIVCVAKRTADGNDIEIIAGFLSFKTSKEEAAEAMQQVRDSRPAGAKVEVFCEPTDFKCEYARQRDEQPTGYRFCSENAYISNDADDVPGVLEKAFTSLPTQKSFALYFAMNPTSRRPLPAMAHSLQSDHYFAVYTIWDDAADDARCTDWVRGIMKASSATVPAATWAMRTFNIGRPGSGAGKMVTGCGISDGNGIRQDAFVGI